MKRMSTYRRGKWVRSNNIISSKNKVVDVVCRQVWFTATMRSKRITLFPRRGSSGS